MQTSAVPERLRGFRARSRELEVELVAAAAALTRALDALRQAPATAAPAVPPLELDVLRWHHDARRLAAWVGEVGDAFAAADSSPEPGPVVVGDEAALVAGPSPAQLRPPPLVGLLALLDLGSSPWIEARFPALASRRAAARARLGEMAADRRGLAVEAYMRRPTDRPLAAAVEARAGDVEAARLAARATPAEVAAFVDLLDRHSVLDLVVQLAVALGEIDGHLSGADRRWLRSALGPLRARVETEWPSAAFTRECATPAPRPAGLDEARRALEVPPPPRRTADVAEGFANGLVAGALDERGYDNGWGEAARVLGQVVSGLLIYGDVRDGAVHLARRQWGEAALDAVGVVPVAGDGIKILRGGSKVVDGGRPLTRMDEAIQDLEHLRRVYAPPRRSRQELVRAAQDAIRLGNEGERLEGRVALMVQDDLVALRHIVRSEGRIVGEVDVVTTKALIEVTGSSSSKAKQVRKLLIQMDLNPHTRPVVLFAPKYSPGAERAIVAMGAHVVRTEQELTALLRTLSGPVE